MFFERGFYLQSMCMLMQITYLFITYCQSVYIGFKYRVKVFCLFKNKSYCLFKMRYFNHFCCCWSARYGSIIIAWLNIAFSLSSLLAIAIALGEQKFMLRLIKELEQDLEYRYEDGLVTTSVYEKTYVFYDKMERVIPCVLIIGFIYYIASISVNVLMLFGVSKKICGMLVPWLLYGVLQSGVQLGYTFGFSIFLISSGDFGFGFLNLSIFLLITATGVYFWMVVFSVYKNICNSVHRVNT